MGNCCAKNQDGQSIEGPRASQNKVKKISEYEKDKWSIKTSQLSKKENPGTPTLKFMGVDMDDENEKSQILERKNS